MDRHQPGEDPVDEMMQHVCIANTVHGSIHGQAEERDVSHVSGGACVELRDHSPGRERFHEDEIGHDGNDVVVRGERCQPVDGEVVDPDDEDGDVDGEDPEH